MTAHKGTWNDHIFPQNTLASISKAIDNQYQAIEFDVLATKDNQLVLAHDQKLKKISNCEGEIKNLKLSALLNCKIKKNTLLPITQILLKKVKRPQYMSSASEVLDYLIANEAKLIWIDLKDNTIAASNILIDLIKSKRLTAFESSTIVVNSTSLDVLKNIKSSLPNIGRSIEGKWGAEPLTNRLYFLETVLNDITHLSLNVGLRVGDEPLYKVINKRKRFEKRLKALLIDAHSKNIKVIGWTVNNLRKLKRLSETDLDYLLTDKTATPSK